MRIVVDPKLPHLRRVETSKVRKEWKKFVDLAADRYEVVLHHDAVRGKVVTCDNIKVGGPL